MVRLELSDEDAQFLFVHLERDAIRIAEEISHDVNAAASTLPSDLRHIDHVCDALVAALSTSSTSSTATPTRVESPPSEDVAAAQRPPDDS